MFVTDLKKEFYDVILGSKVLLLVGYDVDALCSCKILQYLFQCDNVLYTLVPVHDNRALTDIFHQHANQTKYVIMINCGSSIDIVEKFEPSEDVVFFVSDTHRPIDVYNVYSDSQVRLLMKPESDESIPPFEVLFRDDDDEDNSETRRLDEAAILRRRERREWEENRHKVMFDYTQFGYYGLSSALLMFDMAWKMSRDSNELLWWAIVGLTEQYLFGYIEHSKYMLHAASLQNHVLRHNHRGSNSTGPSVSSIKISFDKELNLSLYRHWSLMESFMHTRYTACKFKLWTLKGQKKMYEFLAEIGLPLTQCRQKYTSMDIEFRTNLLLWIEDMSEKYRLSKMIFGSFNFQHGFKHKFCATDIVYAVNALLESTDKEKTQADRFLNALDALSKGESASIHNGLEHARSQLAAILRQVQTFLDMNHIISAGPFLYAVIQDGCPDSKYFMHPSCLTMLAYFLLHAHVNNTKSSKTKSLPLILMAPDEDSDKCMVIGIPPVSEGSPKNFFGKAFEQAAQRSKISTFQDYFDSSLIKISSGDKSKFFDALTVLLS